MLLEAKISNPVCIRLGENSNVIMADKNNKEDCSLTPGSLFNGEHYGFVLIIDYNGKQKEIVYPTQCRIEAMGMQDGHLRVFEEGKKFAWIFDKSGKLEHSAFDEFTDEFRSKFDTIVENYDMFMGNPTLKNPVSIKIVAKYPEVSVILKDENIHEDYPLFPGVMLGTEHYGFILIIDTDKGQKEVVYPTQNRIDAIGYTGDKYFPEKLEIFENGKYHPWTFSVDGKLEKESSYNQYSRRDQAFFEKHYGLNEIDAEHFMLNKKK